MAQCEVCGGDFEERGFQVLVSGRPRPYDRIDCAERGRVLAAAGGAAFVRPFKARTIVIDAPRTAVAAVASASVAGSLLARASLARAKLAFGGAWLLATGLAATSLYLSTRPESAARAAGSGAAEAPTGVEPADSVPFVHQADLPPVRAGGPPAKKPAAKPKPQPLLVKGASGNDSPPVAASPPSAPSSAPSQEPPAPPPAIQPVEPPPPPPAGEDDEESTKPGWGHGDDNHEHSGPPGKAEDD